MTLPTIAVIDGQVTTTSQNIADVFGKRHDHVVRAIRDLIEQLPPEALPNFGEGYYTTPETGDQQHRMYTLTRDGFTLLAMGFTGRRALAFKLAYIEAFNKMEATLRMRGRAEAAQLHPRADRAKTACDPANAPAAVRLPRRVWYRRPGLGDLVRGARRALGLFLTNHRRD